MAALNTSKETAQAIVVELVKVGVAFSFSRRESSAGGWSHRIEVDDARTELLLCIRDIVVERRSRAAESAFRISVKASAGSVAGEGPDHE